MCECLYYGMFSIMEGLIRDCSFAAMIPGSKLRDILVLHNFE